MVLSGKSCSRQLGCVVKRIVHEFLKSTDGATAIEYGLISALISLAIITTLQLLGPALDAVFQIITDAFDF